MIQSINTRDKMRKNNTRIKNNKYEKKSKKKLFIILAVVVSVITIALSMLVENDSFDNLGKSRYSESSSVNKHVPGYLKWEDPFFSGKEEEPKKGLFNFNKE